MNSCNPFHPWKPPFQYNLEGQIILDANGERFLDVRGWGFLTSKGGLNMGADAAGRVQDAAAKLVVEIINKHCENH